MKKIFLFLVFTFTIANGQNNISGVIEYSYKISNSEVTRESDFYSILKYTPKESLYEIDYSKTNFETNKDRNNNVINLKSSTNGFVYKNTESDLMYYMDKIGLTTFNIKDSLNFMDWSLNENTKEVLGYKCQEATTNYGGRFYIAYYTTEIPISNGPWRFNGLPGLILEVHSIDKVFSLVATSLEIKNEKIEIKNPFENKKCMSWQEFLDLYKKKYDEVLRNNMTEFGPGMELAKKGIVEYIKD